MSSSIDVVAATAEPPLDFVAALSAEQGCDVCHELHASVYERRCSRCGAAVCPDCAPAEGCTRCPAPSAQPLLTQPWVTRARAEAAKLQVALVLMLAVARAD